MQFRLARWINHVLTMTGQQLQLCCHREVGNLPVNVLRQHEARVGRLR